MDKFNSDFKDYRDVLHYRRHLEDYPGFDKVDNEHQVRGKLYQDSKLKEIETYFEADPKEVKDMRDHREGIKRLKSYVDMRSKDV